MRIYKLFNIRAKCIITSFLLLFCINCAYAQLQKVANIEKVKSFTNGSVVLNKTTVDETEIFSVTLPNNSKYHQPIVFYLGNKEEMMNNLRVLSDALESGEKGEVFNFSACGRDYQLTFGKTFGQKCFKIWEPINTHNDFGRFFKATIDEIINYISNSEN